MKTRILPSGNVLRFDIEKHAYAVFRGGASTAATQATAQPSTTASGMSQQESNADDGIVCTSVSGVLDRCFPFDTMGVAEKVASKSEADVIITEPQPNPKNPSEIIVDAPLRDIEGHLVKRKPTAQEIIKRWSARATLGSNVHAFIEQRIQRLPLSPRIDTHGEEHLYYPTAYEASGKVLEEYDPVEIELMIASPDLKLAGTIDFLGRSKATGGLIVGDWKTSSSTFSEFRHHNFETPSADTVSYLAGEKQRRYALQTLVYGYLLRREGYLGYFKQPVVVADDWIDRAAVRVFLRADEKKPMGRVRDSQQNSCEVEEEAQSFMLTAPPPLPTSPNGITSTVEIDAEGALGGKLVLEGVSCGGGVDHASNSGMLRRTVTTVPYDTYAQWLAWCNNGGGIVAPPAKGRPAKKACGRKRQQETTVTDASLPISTPTPTTSTTPTTFIPFLPLEYGIVQMSKRIDGTVGVQYKKVRPSDVVPPDAEDGVTADDVIRSLIGL